MLIMDTFWRRFVFVKGVDQRDKLLKSVFPNIYKWRYFWIIVMQRIQFFDADHLCCCWELAILCCRSINYESIIVQMWLIFIYAHLWCTANSWLKNVRQFLTYIFFQKFDISYKVFGWHQAKNRPNWNDDYPSKTYIKMLATKNTKVTFRWKCLTV